VARIVIATYAVRFPVGGFLLFNLHLALGFHRLGNDVHIVERAEGPQDCWNPETGTMTSDPTAGMQVMGSLLERHGMADRLGFVAWDGEHYGLDARQLQEVFKGADLFLDAGAHGTWADHAALSGRSALLDGEPGWTQMRWVNDAREGRDHPRFDSYFTVGQLVGDPRSTAPTADVTWVPTFYPIATDDVPQAPSPSRRRLTTVMSWQAHEPLHFDGVTYGQKEVEFAKFSELPLRVSAELEIAVKGSDIPLATLLRHGWHVVDGLSVSRTLDGYLEYIRRSAAEFSVAKNVFVATNCGWFSERTQTYLASGVPAIVQDTGFSAVLPTGQGLFAVTNIDEAAAAIDEVLSRPHDHSRWARELAEHHFSAAKVCSAILDRALAS
jgi:hypothetical protein